MKKKYDYDLAWERIQAKFRMITTRQGWKTDSEEEWLARAKKAIYGRWGRYPQRPTNYMIKQLNK